MMFFILSESRLRDAYTQLKKRGVVLASNQVHYSLVYRLPEKNGVKRTCEELGISLIAYSPMGQGEKLAFPSLFALLAVVVTLSGRVKSSLPCKQWGWLPSNCLKSSDADQILFNSKHLSCRR